jgi:hypothetical protein
LPIKIILYVEALGGIDVMYKFVRLIKLPTKIKGTTVPDSDGNYNIYLNKDLSYEMQAETLQHEINHVKSNDFYNYSPVKVLEDKAKYKIKKDGECK